MPETTPTDAAADAPAVKDEASIEDLVAALGDPKAGAARSVDPNDPGYADLELADELPVDPDDDIRDVDGEASPRLVSIVESLLFAASKPLRVKDIRRLLKEPTKRQIQLALKVLMESTKDRGIVLGQVAGGFRLRTHPDNAEYVQRLIAGRPVRLSRSQLEALAVIAYRQPVTKSEIDHIRGVDCGAVLRLLLERDLAKIVGRKEEPGRPHVYGTSVKFLEFFNLRSLRDMPDLHEFRELNDENAATLRESFADPGTDEQEAMGQERIEFPDAEGADPPSEAPDHESEGAEDADAGAADAEAAQVQAESIEAGEPDAAASGEPEGVPANSDASDGGEESSATDAVEDESDAAEPGSPPRDSSEQEDS